jgi:hypothetical protein
LNYVQDNENNSDSWYISQSESKSGNWIIHLKILGDDCEEKFIYIDKQSGSVIDVRGGNAC